MLEIEGLTLGPVQTNCYIVWNAEKQCLIVDPGEESGKIVAVLEKRNLKPEAILLTHAHFDHIGAVDEIKERYGIPVYLHEAEQEWPETPELNGSGKYPFLPDLIVGRPDCLIGNEKALSIGSFDVQLLHTPGHSPGSVSFLFPDEGIAIVGDTLFRGSIGRTDLVGGSYEVLLQSIREKLLILPENTTLYPGHGPSTTARIEKTTNPFLKER